MIHHLLPYTCRYYALTFFLLISLASSLHAQTNRWPQTLTDASGQQVTLSQAPVRIVSLIPSNTEMLFALGLDDEIVGVTNYCDYPPKAKQKPKIGDLGTFSVEQIVATNPDLVVCTKDNPKELLQGLKALGIPVFVMNPQTVDQVLDALTTLGQLTGRGHTADSLVQSLRQQMKTISDNIAQVPQSRRPTIFFGNPKNAAHWTPGPGTFTTNIITLAGGRNIADDLRDGAWEVYSLEQIVAKNPEAILTTASINRTAEVSQEMMRLAKTLPGWRDISAVRNQRVYAIPEGWVMRPGPRVVKGVQEIAKQLYPDLFRNGD